MNSNRQLIPSLYFVAFVLIVIPVFDAATSVYPFHFGYSQWRFGIFGLLSNALLLPTIGMLLAVVTAVTQRHVRTQRTLGIACWVLAVVLVGVALTFCLDAAQSRKGIKPVMALSFFVASMTAVAKLLVGAASLAVFARACRNMDPETVIRTTVPAPTGSSNPSRMLLNSRDHVV
jgi:hypothetical protein